MSRSKQICWLICHCRYKACLHLFSPNLKGTITIRIKFFFNFFFFSIYLPSSKIQFYSIHHLSITCLFTNTLVLSTYYGNCFRINEHFRRHPSNATSFTGQQTLACSIKTLSFQNVFTSVFSLWYFLFLKLLTVFLHTLEFCTNIFLKKFEEILENTWMPLVWYLLPSFRVWL